MAPGFKYHVVTISAIFFALTVGLVVGSVFVSPQFVTRQERAVYRLQETLNSDVEEKRREIEEYRECVTALAPLALKGWLRSAAVAVIQAGDYPEIGTSVSQALSVAAPRRLVHITLTPALDRTAQDLQQSLSDMPDADPPMPADRDALMQALSGTIARGDSAGSSFLARLEQRGLLKLNREDDYTQPVRYVVFVTGSRSIESTRAARVDVPLIRALLKQGVAVIACEGRDAVASDIPALREFRGSMSTVDNVDTDIGRCALVLAFSSPHGGYGVKPGVVHLIPPPMQAP